MQDGIDQDSIPLVSRAQACHGGKAEQFLHFFQMAVHPQCDGDEDIPACFSLVLKYFVHIIALLGTVHEAGMDQ